MEIKAYTSMYTRTHIPTAHTETAAVNTLGVLPGQQTLVSANGSHPPQKAIIRLQPAMCPLVIPLIVGHHCPCNPLVLPTHVHTQNCSFQHFSPKPFVQEVHWLVGHSAAAVRKLCQVEACLYQGQTCCMNTHPNPLLCPPTGALMPEAASTAAAERQLLPSPPHSLLSHFSEFPS